MNVLVVNSARDWGGGETHTLELVRGMKERDINITVLCRQRSQLQKRLSVSGIKTFNLPLLNAIDLYSIFRLRSYLRNEKIDVIHAHLSRDYWLCCLAALEMPKVKVVLTRHVLFPLKESIFHTFLLKRVQKIICISSGVKDVLLKHPGIRKDKLAIIPNCISNEGLKNKDSAQVKGELGIGSNQCNIGVFGSIETIKGQKDFIEMAHLLNLKGINAKFFIVGKEKDKKYTEEVKVLTDRYKMGDVVSFTGHRQDVYEIMKAMDIIVSTAKFDAFGLIIIEALAQGRPIVAYSTQGAVEICKEISSVEIVPIGEFSAMAEKVIELAFNCCKRQEIGYEGAQKVRELYSSENMINKILDVYSNSEDEICKDNLFP